MLPFSSAQFHEALKHHFGFDTFKGNQEAIINSLCQGHDVFVLMPTGAGKSLCYQLPALIQQGTAIVISPLIALMKNQVDAMRHFSDNDDMAHFLNSSLSKKESERVKNNVLSGRTKLLYVAPESFGKTENVEFLKDANISFYAVDEAHCISEWGHDFRPDYRKIRPVADMIGKAPVIALTATATQKVQHDIQKNLGILDAIVYKSSFNRPNLYYEVRPKTPQIDRDIIKYIRNNPGKSGIIYCLSRKKVEELAELLSINGIKARPYHAGLDASTRAKNQDAFIQEDIDVIVATIAFGMGIDKPDVRFVIHYDMPKSLEGYYQETGRAGRDGLEGRCITFYSARDLQKMEKFLQDKPLTEQEIGRQLLKETAAYAETSMCRRRALLFYFGERYTEHDCHNCDNCLHPKKSTDAQEELVALLETVIALKEKFRAEPVINLLLGKNIGDVMSFGHNELSTFGLCRHRDERFMSAVVRQAVIEGYLERDIINFGLLKVPAKGLQYLLDPRAFNIVEDTDFTEFDSETDSAGSRTCAADEELFSILRDLRKTVAKRLNLPPYIIFQDPSLEAMATTYPVTLEELQGIPGVGAGKAKRYGKEFVQVIEQYVRDNDIERPEDLRVRSVTNKSKLKIFIIQSIDRKTSLNEIARAKGLEMDELIEKLESIVNSGIKINIDYYLEDVLDDDVLDDLNEYFKNCETDNLEAAFKEFENDCTEQEVRLARVQFISEMGN